jgi:hypothetical protein
LVAGRELALISQGQLCRRKGVDRIQAGSAAITEPKEQCRASTKPHLQLLKNGRELIVDLLDKSVTVPDLMAFAKSRSQPVSTLLCCFVVFGDPLAGAIHSTANKSKMVAGFTSRDTNPVRWL